jgi:hypothetical protein
MKSLSIRWSGVLSFLFLSFVLSNTSGCIRKLDRTTVVYGRVTDQAGQPVDSVTILFAGHKGVSGGVPIKETLTDSNGSYEIVVDVPKKYLYASIVSSLDFESLSSKYSSQNRLIYENGVQKSTCCIVVMGGKTKYDFVLLPK